jgi:hypothetical protein
MGLPPLVPWQSAAGDVFSIEIVVVENYAQRDVSQRDVSLNSAFYRDEFRDMSQLPPDPR